MNVQNAKSFRYQFLKYQRRCGINFFLTIRRSRPPTAAAELRALAGEIMSNEQEAAPKTTSSLGWLFWVQMIVIFAIIKLFGLLGGLIAWGVWSLERVMNFTE